MTTRTDPYDNLRATMRKAGRWCVAHPWWSLLVYLACVTAFFLAFPQVDLWASGLFYSPAEGFSAENSPLLRQVRHLGPHIVRLIAVFSVCVLVFKLLAPGRAPLIPLRKPLFLLGSLILGPGVVVNAILKDHWGRPRPRMIVEFGGDLPYQKVWWISDLCGSNCSFVSGEASAALWLVAAVFVLPVAWRRSALLFAVPLALVLSVNRVAFGGHFLSDTLMSWGVTAMVALAVHRVLYRWCARMFDDRRLDIVLTRASRKTQTRMRSAWLRTTGSARRFAAMFRDAS